MSQSNEYSIKEAWDYINKMKKEQADKWIQKNTKRINEAKEFKNEYYRILEERMVNETAMSELLESYKNNLLSKALKAIYITALEAETLTDDGIIVAEGVVDQYIDEQGGATKLMNKNSGKTYFLDMLFNKINEAANKQMEDFISGKNEIASLESYEDEEIKEKSKSFIRGIGESEGYSSIFNSILNEDDDNTDDKSDDDEDEDSSDDEDPMADPDLGGDEIDVDDDEEDKKDDESDTDEESDKSEEDSKEEDKENEEDEEPSTDAGEKPIDSDKEDPMGDADLEDEREAPESNDQDDDEIVDDDKDGEDDNNDASEEKDLRDDLTGDEKKEVDPENKSDDEFLQDLDQEEDVKKAVELIRARVANAEEEFIKRNAEDKKKINDLLGKISDNVKVVKDISDNDSDKTVGDEVVDSEEEEEIAAEESVKVKIAKEKVNVCKNMIHNIRENKSFTVYEKFARNLSTNIMKDASLRESYTIDGEIDFYGIMESTKILYAWLETVNTLQLEKVNKDYIKKVITTMK